MTYHPPNSGYPQQPQPGYPAAPTGSSTQPPQPPGSHWSVAPPPRRRPTLLIVLAIAVLAAAGGILIVVLASGGGSSSLRSGTPASSAATAPHVTSGAPTPNGSAPGNTRPLPPPTPTGRLYEDDDPQVGDCVDLARKPTGVSIYQADCDDPAATLILESVQGENQECPGKGYFGLDSLDKKLLCFTYSLRAGDCVDLKIPRRVACADPAAPPSGQRVVTVADIKLGQQDGAGCANPAQAVQVGKGPQRGVACLTEPRPNTPSKSSR